MGTPQDGGFKYMATVGLIHSTRLVIQAVHDVVAKANPELEIINVLDEGLLKLLREKAFDRIGPRMTDSGEGLEEDGCGAYHSNLLFPFSLC